MNRWKAAGIHLLSSALIVGGFVLSAFFLWYPEPYRTITGVSAILGILALVDVGLGPLCTWVVYKPAKKSLKWDLAAIVCVQIVAFAWGGWTVFFAHPVYLTFTDTEFQVVTFNAVGKTADAPAPYNHTPIFGRLRLVYVEKPTGKELGDAMARMFNDSVDIFQSPVYYRPYEQARTAILSAAGQLRSKLVYGESAKDKSGKLCAPLKLGLSSYVAVFTSDDLVPHEILNMPLDTVCDLHKQVPATQAQNPQKPSAAVETETEDSQAKSSDSKEPH